MMSRKRRNPDSSPNVRAARRCGHRSSSSSSSANDNRSWFCQQPQQLEHHSPSSSSYANDNWSWFCQQPAHQLDHDNVNRLMQRLSSEFFGMLYVLLSEWGLDIPYSSLEPWSREVARYTLGLLYPNHPMYGLHGTFTFD
ncbi:uncharacterized protein LOC131009324 [Salvia miltiorrhiza]|uniref:uncharacterized protein LOC131009324 n=1 Tax=Salvia miltiorrhiza TaxID=226208 RepID=UPI0025AD4953|nr:uncharacterized protein LOC131009324 [Salvia miltiorrhiza]